MHFGGLDEVFEPRKKRLTLRASFEAHLQQSQRHRSENYQSLEKETRAESGNPATEQTKHLNTQEDREDKHGDDVTEYERKRKENILRNQAWMQQLGFSSAKMAIRTAVCGEATKKETNEAKRQKAAERQAQRAAQLAERQAQPLRKSRRVQRATEMMMDTRKTRRRREVTEEMKAREKRTVQQQFSRRLADNARNRRLRERNSRKLEDLQEDSQIDEDSGKSESQEGKIDDSCPAALVQLTSPPNIHNFNAFDNRPTIEENQHETNVGRPGPVLHGDVETQTNRSTNQTSKHESPGDNSTLEEMVEFEHKRRENILRNQAYMQQVGVSVAKLAARTSIGDEAGKEAKKQELAAKRELKAARKAELPNQPVRKSQRTAIRKVAIGHPTASSYSLELFSMKTRNQNNVNFMDAMDGDGQAFLKEFAGKCKKQNALTTYSIDKAVEYSLSKDDVVKALPFRTTGMAFHPRGDRILLACGDKEGHISLWSPSDQASDNTLSSASATCVCCQPDDVS